MRGRGKKRRERKYRPLQGYHQPRRLAGPGLYRQLRGANSSRPWRVSLRRWCSRTRDSAPASPAFERCRQQCRRSIPTDTERAHIIENTVEAWFIACCWSPQHYAIQTNSNILHDGITQHLAMFNVGDYSILITVYITKVYIYIS